MGATSSKAVVDSALNVSSVTSNDTFFKAGSDQSCDNIMSQQARGNCKNINDGSVQTCKSFASAASFQKAIQEATNSITSKQTVKNASEAISQNLSFNPSSTQSETITNSVTKILNQISNVIKGETANRQTSTNSESQQCWDYGKNLYTNVNQTALQQSIVDAVQDSKQVADSKTELISYIDNIASSKVENSLGQILAMIALIIGLIIGAPMLMTAGVFRSMSRYAMVLFVLWMYIFVACNKFLQKFIFVRKLGGWCKDEKKKKIVHMIAIILSLILSGLIIKEFTTSNKNNSQELNI